MIPDAWVSAVRSLVAATAFFCLEAKALPVQESTELEVFEDPAPPKVLEIDLGAAADAADNEEVTFRAPPRPLSADAITEDWPHFLGPRFNCTSSETRLLKDWSKEGPAIVWEMRRGQSYSSPVFVGDRLVYFHRIGDEEVVECLEAGTGKRFWRHGSPTTYRDAFGYNNGPRASPVIDGDFVYVLGAQGVLRCIHLGSGALCWRRELMKEFSISQDFFGIASTPLLWKDFVVVNLGAPGGPCAAAFDKHSGKMVWGAGRQWGASCASPIPAMLGGRERLLLFAGGKSRPPVGGLLCLDPASGRVDFEFSWRSKSFESVNAATPVVIGDTVFISASYDTGSALLKVLPEGGQELVWTSKDIGLHFNTPVFIDGHFYGPDGRNEPDTTLACWDASTGEVKWRTTLEWEETFERGGKSITRAIPAARCSLLLADGACLCLGEMGHLLWLDLSPQGCEETARCWLFAAGETWTPPIVHKGLLYICQNARDLLGRSEPRLLCYDLRGQ